MPRPSAYLQGAQVTHQEWLDYSVEQDFWRSVCESKKANRLNTSRRDSDVHDWTILVQGYEEQCDA